MATLAALWFATPCHADQIVTRCTTDTEGGPGAAGSLATAIAAGGRIRFQCPAGTSIRMTSRHLVPGGTTLDGGGTITLDAHGSAMTMFVVEDGRFSIEGLTLRGGQGPITSSRRSSLVAAAGDFVLRDSTIEASVSPIQVRGHAEIFGSAFLGNTGGALAVEGEASVEQSRFIANDTGLFVRRGTVRGSLFSENRVAALHVFLPTDRVLVRDSTFDRNSGRGAVLASQRSGRGAAGVLEMRRCAFTQNSSSEHGGAISVYDSVPDAPTEATRRVLGTFPPARFEITYDRFVGNRGKRGGAIDANLANTLGMVVRAGIFTDNEASDSGGAMAWEGGAMTVTHTVFLRNRAATRGAAVFGRHGDSTLANVLVVENSAGPQGGAIDVAGGAIVNVTVAKNNAIGLVTSGGPNVVTNTIISGNANGNCAGTGAVFGPGDMEFGGQTCPGVTNADPFLDSLYVPSLGSVALGLGDRATCHRSPVDGRDIAFQPRKTARCAAGAYENFPARLISPRRD